MLASLQFKDIGTHTHTHTYTHKYTRIHTQMHTHTHKYTCNTRMHLQTCFWVHTNGGFRCASFLTMIRWQAMGLTWPALQKKASQVCVCVFMRVCVCLCVCKGFKA
jgi:hypothetical protein